MKRSSFVGTPALGGKHSSRRRFACRATRWRGTTILSNWDLSERMAQAPSPNAAIGILSADEAQTDRARVKVLAYQHSEQDCGYWPDKDAHSNEKQNVRDGHYRLWGPVHLLARIGKDGSAANPLAGEVISYISGEKTVRGEADWLRVVAERHLVPSCAMKVKRAGEMGPLQLYAPPNSCGCYYEELTNGSSTCQACKAAADCSPAAPKCNYGFCEAQ